MSRSRTGSYRKLIAARAVSNSRRGFLWTISPVLGGPLPAIKRQITNPILEKCKSQLLDKGSRLASPLPLPLSLYRSPCLSLIFMEPKRSHGPLKSRVIELWDHRKCLQFISIMPLGSELQANRLLAAYLFSQVNRLSLFYVQFFHFFYFCLPLW